MLFVVQKVYYSRRKKNACLILRTADHIQDQLNISYNNFMIYRTLKKCNLYLICSIDHYTHKNKIRNNKPTNNNEVAYYYSVVF